MNLELYQYQYHKLFQNSTKNIHKYQDSILSRYLFARFTFISRDKNTNIISCGIWSILVLQVIL